MFSYAAILFVGRQEAWREGGQDAIARIEPYIREQRLDAEFVDDY